MKNRLELGRMNLEEALEDANKVKKVLKRRYADQRPRFVDYEEASLKVDKERDNNIENPEDQEERDIEQLFDLVLFDWDGVMYDSMENIARYAQEVCKLFDKEVDVQEFLKRYDQPFWDFYEREGIPCSTPEQRKEIYELYHSKVRPVLENDPSVKQPEIYPETAGIVKDLKSRGLKVGIVSAHKPEEIEAVLKDSHIEVDFLIGAAHNKTEEIKRVCEENGFDLERVLMLGDLPSDLRDARKAGVKVGAVARFKEAEDRLASYDPDYLFHSIGPEMLRLKKFQDKLEE